MVTAVKRAGVGSGGPHLLAAGTARPQPGSLLGVEHRLAQPDRGRGHLGALAVRAELQRLPEGQQARRKTPPKAPSRGPGRLGSPPLFSSVSAPAIRRA